MRRRFSAIAVAIAVPSCVLCAVACGDGGAEDGGSYTTSSSSSSTTTGSGTPPPPPDAGPDALPPEKELESTYGVPVATGRYVWIPNPASGRVAYIDAETLTIALVEAGHAPTHLVAVPGQPRDTALVLNVLSRDATLLRAGPEGLDAHRFDVGAGGNAWAVARDGSRAVAWTDARKLSGADPIDGYQDLTVLDLAEGAERSTPLTVGYRPVAVAFDDAATRAFAVTQDGVTIVDLLGDEPAVVGNVPLSDDPLENASTRDVAITPDGRWALVRREGVARIRLVSLEGEGSVDVPLSAPATDLDLSADGTTAILVVRDTSEVVLLDVEAVAADPEALVTIPVPGVVVGSASLAESAIGFFYTGAIPSEILTVIDTGAASPQPRHLDLRAPIAAVFPTRDASHALAVHWGLSGSDYVAAISVAPIAVDLPAKLVGLDAPVAAVAMGPDGDRAIVATASSGSGPHAMVVAAMPSLQVTTYSLASKPIAAGIVSEAGRGFVAQEHPDGRITFVRFGDGEVRTLTGFELATEVVDGSGQ